MCTLYTFDIDTYCDNYKAVSDQIWHDGVFNNDGASLLTDTGILIRSVEDGDGIQTVLDALDSFRWKRVWIHLRAATTGYVGLDACHGFQGGRGVFVFHNGVINNKLAESLQVDSELIARVTAKLGVEKATDWLQRREKYANVFIVDTVEGEYHVSRSITGQLHTDGAGNYSSHAIKGIIDQPVPQNSTATYGFTPPGWRFRSVRFG